MAGVARQQNSREHAATAQVINFAGDGNTGYTVRATMVTMKKIAILTFTATTSATTTAIIIAVMAFTSIWAVVT